MKASTAERLMQSVQRQLKKTCRTPGAPQTSKSPHAPDAVHDAVHAPDAANDLETLLEQQHKGLAAMMGLSASHAVLACAHRLLHLVGSAGQASMVAKCGTSLALTALVSSAIALAAPLDPTRQGSCQEWRCAWQRKLGKGFTAKVQAAEFMWLQALPDGQLQALRCNI